MINYIIRILDLFPDKMKVYKKRKITLAQGSLFMVKNKDDPVLLSEEDRTMVHSSTSRLLFLERHAHSQTNRSILFLCTRVKKSNQDNYKKWTRIKGYLYDTLSMPLILGTDNSGTNYRWTDTAHAVDIRYYAKKYVDAIFCTSTRKISEG